jgi:hypothetical protein
MKPLTLLLLTLVGCARVAPMPPTSKPIHQAKPVVSIIWRDQNGNLQCLNGAGNRCNVEELKAGADEWNFLNPPAPSLSCAPECKLEVRAKREVRVPRNPTTITTQPPTESQPICDHGFELIPMHAQGCGPYVNLCLNDTFIPDECVRVTHELYLGGTKIGTVEEK